MRGFVRAGDRPFTTDSQLSARPAGRDVGAPSGITYKHAYYKTAYARRTAENGRFWDIAPDSYRLEFTSDVPKLTGAFSDIAPSLQSRARGYVPAGP